MEKNKNKLKLVSFIGFSLIAFSSLAFTGYQYLEKNNYLTSNSKSELSMPSQEQPQSTEPELSPENPTENPVVPTEQEQQTENSEPEEIKKEKESEPEPTYDLVIGLIADAHAGQDHGYSHLNSAVWVLNNQPVKPDIVIDVGDLIESRNDDGFISKKEAKADYRKSRNIISAYFPIYNVIGNHELLSLSKEEVSEITGRKNYYALTIKNNYRLIVLDANYTDAEEHIDAKHDDSFIYTGTLSDRQLAMLESELKKNDKNLIFIHHPLWNLTNKNSVSRILKKYADKIVLVANGHKHPLSLQAIDFGNVKNYNLPSAYHQRMVSVAKINGLEAEVITKKY